MVWSKANSTTGHVLGVDLSEWTNAGDASSIDWTAVKASGVKFVYMRASRGYTDKTGGALDKSLDGITSGTVTTAALPIGYYHYANANNASVYSLEDARIEARFFADAIRSALAKVGKSGYGDLMPVLDFEAPADKATATITKQQLLDWMTEFIHEFETYTGQMLMIYTAKWFYEMWGYAASETGVINARPLWESQYIEDNAFLQSGNEKDRPRAYGGWSDWALWQYSDTGRWIDWQGTATINGLTGDTDRNWAQSIAAISARPATTAKPTTPAPAPTTPATPGLINRSTVRRIATVERLLEPRTRKAWKKATARPNVGDQVRMARTTNVLTVTAYNTATNVLTMKDGPGNLYYYTAASWGDTTLEVLE